MKISAHFEAISAYSRCLSALIREISAFSWSVSALIRMISANRDLVPTENIQHFTKVTTMSCCRPSLSPQSNDRVSATQYDGVKLETRRRLLVNEINTSTKTVLYAQNIRKSFGTRGNVQQVLKGINLRVSEGEFVGIMGASGAGKTTLLNVLATIDQTTEGTILIDEVDISRMKDKELSAFRRDKLGFIFQDYNLLDTLTVKENILLPVSLGKVGKEQAEAEFNTIATILSITDHANKYPHEISGGQKQRTSAARALINKPAMVFADEPTGALDSKSASSLLGTLEDVNKKQGVTIMMVTHDPLASSYCSRVVFLKDGMIYSELYKGDKTRQAFFQEILKVQGILGGDSIDSI